MYDRSSEPNVYSKYQHEEDSLYDITLKSSYIAKKENYDKITVIRAVSKNNEGKYSEIITKSYFVMDKEKLNFYKGLPVVSLDTNPDKLFDKDIWIYVAD